MPNEIADLCTAFANSVLSSGKHSALETLIKDVDNSVEETHKFLKELKAFCSSVNNKTEDKDDACNSKDDIARHEEISKFLASGPPRLLLTDMEHLYELELDVEMTISKTTAALEKLRNNTLVLHPIQVKNNFNFNSDLKDYILSLDQFGKRLAYISTIEGDKNFRRDLELERKLQCLCDDVELFWKMVQARMKISQANEKMPQKVSIEDGGALSHVESIKKLVGTINEITFLIQNEN